jgi:hypothetical protein
MLAHYFDTRRDFLLVGWHRIGGYFRLTGDQARDRWGDELLRAGVVFLYHGRPAAWQSGLKEWAAVKSAGKGEIL